MIYQVRANMFFTDRVTAHSFYRQCQDLLEIATIVNLDSDAQECSEVKLINNFHDSDPNEPCLEIMQADNSREIH